MPDVQGHRTEVTFKEEPLAKKRQGEIVVPSGDLEILLWAAKEAAWKMKCEYDNGLIGRGYPLDPNECWVECERLWNALDDFEEIYSGLTGGSVLLGTSAARD